MLHLVIDLEQLLCNPRVTAQIFTRGPHRELNIQKPDHRGVRGNDATKSDTVLSYRGCIWLLNPF